MSMLRPSSEWDMNILSRRIKFGGYFMRKTFELEDLDCANCARKMQEAIFKIEGVKDVFG